MDLRGVPERVAHGAETVFAGILPELVTLQQRDSHLRPVFESSQCVTSLTLHP
jgi:hypothetical protein